MNELAEERLRTEVEVDLLNGRDINMAIFALVDLGVGRVRTATTATTATTLGHKSNAAIGFTDGG